MITFRRLRYRRRCRSISRLWCGSRLRSRRIGRPGVDVTAGLGVGVLDGLGVFVGAVDGFGVAVGLGVAVGCFVGVAVGLGVFVGFEVAVGLGVLVGLPVAVGCAPFVGSFAAVVPLVGSVPSVTILELPEVFSDAVVVFALPEAFLSDVCATALSFAAVIEGCVVSSLLTATTEVSTTVSPASLTEVNSITDFPAVSFLLQLNANITALTDSTDRIRMTIVLFFTRLPSRINQTYIYIIRTNIIRNYYNTPCF